MNDGPQEQPDIPTFSQKATSILDEMGYSELCRPDIDLTTHINKLFPTEQSLSQLDNVIGNIEQEISQLDCEISDLIEEHGRSSMESKDALSEAHATITELEQKIRAIRLKTQSSEDSVHEMTKDIKQLDVAKQNLTVSITTLHHLHLLLTGVNSLNTWIANRQYGDIATELPAVLNVLQLFDDYIHIDHVRNLTDKVQNIKTTLSTQLENDLRQMFKSGNLTQQTTDMCRVADVLGGSLRDDFCRWYVAQQLGVYLVLYSESEDVAWLDKIEERYRWFINKLAEFEKAGAAKVFPPSWEMGRKLAKEFCTLTRQSLEKLMTRRKAEINWKLLAHAINHTIMFETLLCKRFPAKCGFNFHKIIWPAFDRHMDVFLVAQREALTQFVDNCAARVRSGEERPSLESHTVAIPLSSSAELFLLLKRIITESNRLYACPDNILKELSEIFGQCLRSYGYGCLSAFLPQSGSSSITAGSSSSYQGFVSTSSFLLQNLMREDTTIRLTPALQFFTCCILATADWCAETTLQLQEKLRQRINDIELNQEVELFYNISNSALSILVQNADASCDASLQMMTKINWANVETVGDESPYVVAIRKQLQSSVPLIREFLTDRRRYFAHFCLKLITQLVNKFLGALFKCKPISVTGVEQLLLDTHSLKTFLLAMPSVESSMVTKPPTMYTSTVVKGMTKAEMILKLVISDMSNPDNYITHYARMLPDSDSNELQKVLEMRALRRSEQTQLIQIYRQRFETSGLTASSAANGSQHDGSPSRATVSSGTSGSTNFQAFSSVVSSLAADAASGLSDSSMRRLEKLVKKKF